MCRGDGHKGGDRQSGQNGLAHFRLRFSHLRCIGALFCARIAIWPTTGEEDAMATIYKIVTRSQWREAEQSGVFHGAPVDRADGFIHFSTVGQVAETAAKHFADQDGLLIVAVDEAALSGALKYEVSRGGALFPHLYADLPLAAVLWARPMPLGADGVHRLPPMDW
jgi:uncharacterized protein (DUF952 family)